MRPQVVASTALLAAVLAFPAAAGAQRAYSDSACAPCHGDSGEGGVGPALAHTKLTYEKFLEFVRKGGASMPPFAAAEFSDADSKKIYDELGSLTPGAAANAKPSMVPKGAGADVYTTSVCVGCHGVKAMGGLGPPIVQTKLNYEKFLKLVREGSGMMPGTPKSVLSDDEVRRLHDELQAGTPDESLIPISARVGKMITARSVGVFFLGVTLFALVFGIRVLCYFLKCAGWNQLRPYVKRFGTGRATGIFLYALLVEGFLVASLWRRDRFRWAMHALLIYGFCGLALADILIQITNPERAQMAMTNPAKFLALISGVSVFSGLCYVMNRYRNDAFIDNGLTMGRDFLFVQLLLNSIVSGFLTVGVNHLSDSGWVMPVYIYHLSAVGLLIATAPFTRFRHVWIVPALVGVTRVVEALTKAKIDPGFEREPSPGRHHKSERIAMDVLRQVDPNFDSEMVLRYYP